VYVAVLCCSVCCSETKRVCCRSAAHLSYLSFDGVCCGVLQCVLQCCVTVCVAVCVAVR